MHSGKYTAEAISYASQALISDHAPNGTGWVPAFEEEFAKRVGATYAIAVNSGTSGLHSALAACGVGLGDQVISPALTVIMDSYATLFCGAEPVFADVREDTWNIDPESIEELITEKTKAILAVSWFGLPANLVALREIADKFGLFLIDDSAETILKREYQSDLEWSSPDIRVFSFESKKHFSTGGEGGMVTTNNAELAEKVRKHAGIGYRHLGPAKGRTHLAARDFQNPDYLRFDVIGFNYRMNPLSAAVGLGQMAGLDKFLDMRRLAANAYQSAVVNFDFLEPQKFSQKHSYYTWGAKFDEVRAGVSWQDFYDLFVSLGGHGFYSNCMVPYLEPSMIGKTFGGITLKQGLCPNAESLQRKIMAFKTNYLEEDLIREQADILYLACEKVAGQA